MDSPFRPLGVKCPCPCLVLPFNWTNVVSCVAVAFVFMWIYIFVRNWVSNAVETVWGGMKGASKEVANGAQRFGEKISSLGKDVMESAGEGVNSISDNISDGASASLESIEYTANVVGDEIQILTMNVTTEISSSLSRCLDFFRNFSL
jgi:hypothetical protein